MPLTNAEEREQSPRGLLDLQHDEAFIIVKAAPRRSETFGETVCCAGIDMAGRWVRLYPVSFRQLSDAQRFRRWDHIRYRWSAPKASKDTRPESRRVDHNSVEIIGPLKQSDRNPLVARCAVTSLQREFDDGRSLALLKAEILDFKVIRRSSTEVAERDAVLRRLQAQQDMFVPKALIPMRTCPFEFKYVYRDDDKVREGTCQDWETEQTFFARRKDLGSENAAVDWMTEMFGQIYPAKGMALAMGTHRYRLDQWLINGVVRLNDDPQFQLI